MWDGANQTGGWATAFLGLAGALAGAAVTWLNSSSTTAKRMRVYQEASGRVSFWEGLLKALQATGASLEKTATLQARIEVELRVALEYVEAVIRGEKARAAYHVKRQNLGNLRRWFLLYRPKRSGWPWVARIMFFLLLIAAPVYCLDPGGVQQLAALSPYVIAPTLIVFAWLFRGISVFLEKPNWEDRPVRYIEVDKLRTEDHKSGF